MNTDLVLLEKDHGIATVTLNQPATLNALTYDVVLRLDGIVADLANEPVVRAVILTGAGRGFCSGVNLLGGTGEALAAGGMGVRGAVMAIHNTLAAIAEMQKPWLAAEIGLINRAVPDDALMDSAREWAGRLAAGPTLAVGAMKLAMRRALHGTFRDALHSEATMLALIAETEDAAEGLMAFFQKREPEFKGR